MKAKLFSLVTILAAMTLVACNGGGNASQSSGGKSSGAASSQRSSSSSRQSSSSSTPSTEWVSGTKTGKFTKQTRASDNGVAYLASIAEAEGWTDAETKMNARSGTNSESAWAIEGLPAGLYDVEFSARMSYDSHQSRYWYNMTWKGNENAASNPDTAEESPYRYFIVVYGSDSAANNVYTDNAETWGDCGLTGSDFNFAQVITGLNLKEGATKVSLKHGDIGYSLAINYVRFIYKGAADATKPYQDVSKLPVDPTTPPAAEAEAE